MYMEIFYVYICLCIKCLWTKTPVADESENLWGTWKVSQKGEGDLSWTFNELDLIIFTVYVFPIQPIKCKYKYNKLNINF